MKKILSVFLCLVTCFYLNGCALFGDKHTEHTFNETWHYNSVYHWKVCEHKDCNERENYEKHTFVDGFCTVCNCKETVLNEHSES